MSITKSDIASNIALKTSLSKKNSINLLDSLISIISSNSKNKDVKIPKFGVFKNKTCPKRLGRNPKTGEEYIISKRNKIRFYPSSDIKNFFN